jgi:hypothetical protein
MNIVNEDNRSRPQGRVVVPVEEDQCGTCSASEGLHMYGVQTLPGLRSSRAVEEGVFNWKSGSATASEIGGFPSTVGDLYSGERGLVAPALGKP